MATRMLVLPDQQKPQDSLWSELPPSLTSQETPQHPGKQDYDTETWHLKFRAFTSSEMSDPIQDMRRLSELCHQWLRPDLNTKEEILDQLVLEQLMISTSPEVQVLIKESGVKRCKDLEEMLRNNRQPEGWSIIILEGQPFLVRDSDDQMTKPTEWGDMMELSHEQQSSQSKEHLNREQDSPQLQNLPDVDEPSTSQDENFLLKTIAEKGDLEYWRSQQTLEGGLKEDREKTAILKSQEPQLLQGPDSVMVKEETFSEEINKETGSTFFHIPERDLAETRENLVSFRSFQKSKPDNSPTPPGGTQGLNNIECSGQDELESAKPPSPADPVAHAADQTAERRAPHVCAVCKKSFLYRSQFIIHERTHTGEKPFECKFCEKGFLQTSDLRVHLRIHTGERPYKCKICHKTFTHKSTLFGHKRIHTSEKPYKCEECQKRFSHKGNLNVHQRIHSNCKPYQCHECGSTFRQLGTFKRHMKIHSKKMMDPELSLP